jgi:hypothetical protein
MFFLTPSAIPISAKEVVRDSKLVEGSFPGKPLLGRYQNSATGL